MQVQHSVLLALVRVRRMPGRWRHYVRLARLVCEAEEINDRLDGRPIASIVRQYTLCM